MYYLNEDLLNHYLYYGNLFFPREDGFFYDLIKNKQSFLDNYPDIVKKLKDPNSLSVSIQHGVGTFKKAVEDILSKSYSSNKLHVVPLSGGLDSRAILACLLDYLPNENILTVTYGWKGTHDFEIGRLISKKAGVKNLSIDMSEFTWNTEKLVSACRLSGWDCFSTPAYVHSFLGLGPENIYWSGFLGGHLVGGADLPKKPSETWQEAKDKFIKKNKLKPITLLSPKSDFSPDNILPQEPLVDRKVIGYDEQLALAIRQATLIKRNRFCDGFDWRAPFIHPSWAGMCLNLPQELLLDQMFYKKVLISGWPQLFKNMPEKKYGKLTKKEKPKVWKLGKKVFRRGVKMTRKFAQNHGILPYKPDLGINRIDMDWALRERTDVRFTIYENLQDLMNRDIIKEVNINKLFDDHQKNIANYGDLLLKLTLLELRIKAGIINHN